MVSAVLDDRVTRVSRLVKVSANLEDFNAVRRLMFGQLPTTVAWWLSTHVSHSQAGSYVGLPSFQHVAERFCWAVAFLTTLL